MAQFINHLPSALGVLLVATSINDHTPQPAAANTLRWITILPFISHAILLLPSPEVHFPFYSSVFLYLPRRTLGLTNLLVTSTDL